MSILNNIEFNKSKYFILLSGIIIFTFHQFIFLHYLSIGTFHFDFQSVFSRLTFGKIWFLKNGLTIPWFTPHICCGAPYYANPQSEFYSPIQFLFLFLKPLTTIKVIFFTYSLLSYFGSYLLLKNIFKLSKNASLIGSTIFLFNHYFAFHYLSGHIGWGLFSLIPIFFYVAAMSFNSTNKQHSLFLIISSAIIFAIMMHSGGTRIIMEILVSIYFLTILHLIKYKDFRFILNISLSVLIGLLISSSKIYAAWSFVSGLSRDVQPLEFKGYLDFISHFFNSFFLFQKSSVEYVSVSANLTIEEHSFSVSIIPLIILIIYLRNFPEITKDKFKLTLSYILFFSVLILIYLNFPNTFFGSLVRKIPFISNDWISLRMLAPLIVLFMVISAKLFDCIKFKKQNFITFLFISIIIIQNLLFDKNKLYQIFTHSEAAIGKYLNLDINKENVNQYKIDSIITVLGKDSKFDGPKQHDFFLNNESIQLCYFSIFGYNLEALRPIVSKLVFESHETLRVRKDIVMLNKRDKVMNVYRGNPLLEKDNRLNFVNPSCYLNPKENSCENNYFFKIKDKESLIKFLNYKPFKFKHLKTQIVFNYLSIIMFFITIMYFFYFIIFYLIKKNPSRNKF